MKFRKKPVEVDAFRLGYDPMPDWFMDLVSANKVQLSSGKQFVLNGRTINETHCSIETLEGRMSGPHGSWIIRGVQGEPYPCKPDIFAATYDPVS